MSAGIVVAAVAPMQADASVRAEQVSQLLYGETADVLETRAEWRRLRAHRDGYEGWVQQGYLRECDVVEALAWRERAAGWSEGATLDVDGHALPLPMGARVALDGQVATLPDGRRGRVLTGIVRPLERVTADALAVAPEVWALQQFEGTPYQWGGRTPWGVDCSGLVQTAYAARGLPLPRDSSKQAACGEPVDPDRIRPGDLLFFHGETTSTVTHVAFAAEADTIVHSTIACGGVVVESRAPGSRAGELLMPRLVGVRRVGHP